MARLSRLALPGLPHLVMLRGLDHQPIVVDDQDRRQCLDALLEASLTQRLAVHAYVLLDNRLGLLVTPSGPAALGLGVQDFGRRYVARFNRRHRRRGPLWEGRFRATVVQPGLHAMQALVFVESAPARDGVTEPDQAYRWSSAGAHLGVRVDPLVSVLPDYWRLGNTPFERESAYARVLAEGLTQAQASRLDAACQKGWAVGDDAFLAELSALTDRPLRPRRPGRPAKPLA